MIYDLGQKALNNMLQWPKFHLSTMTIPHLTTIKSTSVARLELMTHIGTRIDAPSHFFPDAETVDQLPLSHFHAPCVALDLRDKGEGNGMVAADLKPHAGRVHNSMIVLLKTGWTDKRAFRKKFLTAWPYLTGDGEEYLLAPGIHGVGFEGRSSGGFNDLKKETVAHEATLGAKKLVVEHIQIPEAMLNGKSKHLAAFPALIQGACGAWTRAVAWDEGQMQ